MGRIDEHVIFNRLDKMALREIEKLEKRLAEKEIIINITDDALDFLTDVGFDPVYGARPLKRTIQKELESVLARGILDGQYGDGDGISVDCIDNKLEVHKSFDASWFNRQETKSKNVIS